ncbi:hypothetical protein BATDEDRAFT_21748 [Batrachochytrium dendrobatidis JAM81]|uniref:DUF4110 domain-containing protein n=2 Tax=Batrachochytrium dendrobatidis TaxID=109871 RepID=F4NUZ7_BATDJ|nr:uncharacterized protein BATDEDRAFT_21748 [Batrachochytrium dendrobatidis JAM81]EGF84060.1 hypothetical protein BATDEDRAFT_21748 [Batrachochytrium dendrobatidis JAM81]|eukprot:XP_006675370.1 hypothetical protein BATDEDRAFT_21748 [Batrachochytrium dendrobatidis JAM81]
MAVNQHLQEQKSSKKYLKGLKAELDDEPEDIDAILEQFRKAQDDESKITEEADCAPPSRRANASFTANPLDPSELLLFGGEYYDGQKVYMYNDLYKFDTEKSTWKRITSSNSPGPRSSHQTVITPAGRLFLWGGEFVSPNETNFFHYKDFWTMDLKTNAWEKLELRGQPPPRSGHRMAIWKHLIVLFGGFFDNYTDSRYYDDLWVFDTLEYKWTKLDLPEPRPTARSGFQMLTYKDMIYIFGGYYKTFVKGKKPVGTVYSDVWVLKMSLQLDAIRWERRKRPGGICPSLRSGCTMTVHKGRGILFGGVSDVQESEETLESIFHKDIFQYNIDSNKWFPLTFRAIKQHKKKKVQNKKVEDSKQSKECDLDDANNSCESGEDNTQEHESDAKVKVEPIGPTERFNAMLAVSKNNLYVFGGIVEQSSKEFTICDLWTLNLEKLNGWSAVFTDETRGSQWLGIDSDVEDENNSEDESEDNSDDETNSGLADDQTDEPNASALKEKKTQPSGDKEELGIALVSAEFAVKAHINVSDTEAEVGV